ncbi:MAG TPA: copper transporter [Cellulomonas sp.]|uniref:copper transporter n=1 Tax=Cellulomonas sp. TaxID=40001 RepID=UPI002E325D16|nr:copper transporter [Cellulomonas sp.]HEX5334207.1 copper transporter [Cellulomonas sp.]
MIDFRYHIVSLISVFLALAVGIALGAGPLKETIGDTLTGQVKVLRAEKDALRSSLDTSNAELSDANAYVAAAAPGLLAGALSDRRVAVVALGELSKDDEAAIEAQLTAAGATVSARVTVATAWTDPNLSSFRQALVENLADYVSPVPAADAGVETELAEALAQGLTRSDAAKPDALAEPASILLDLLSSGDNPLITLADPVALPADAIVVVAPRTTAAESSATPVAQVDKATTAARVAILRAAQDRSHGAVLADGPRLDGDLTGVILSDAALTGSLTTVSGTGTIAGQVSVALALNARIGGVNGHYGFGKDEVTMPVRVALPGVDRTAQVTAEIPVVPDAPPVVGATPGTKG